MRRAFIRVTSYNSNQQFSLNANHIVLIQGFLAGFSKITLTTEDELFVKESPEELEALLNE